MSLTNIFSKLFTAARGQLNTAGQAAVDSQALVILDQELRDADSELRSARDALAELMGKETLETQKLAERRAKLDEYGLHITGLLSKQKSAIAANNQGDADKVAKLAEEVAEKYAELEGEVRELENVVHEYETSITQLKSRIHTADSSIKKLRSKQGTITAKQHVTKASAAVSAAHSGTNTRLRTALESVERIEAEQNLKAATIDAANSMAAEASSEDLSRRLADVGVGGSATSGADVLNRFKATAA